MRQRRGLIFLLVGIILAGLSGVIILGMARRASEVTPPPVATPEPVKRVYVVVAEKDIPENIAVSAEDVSTKEFPADYAPAGAIAAPEYAVGKYTTTRIYKGQILVAPALSETRQASQLSQKIQDGKLGVAVTFNDSMISLGALRAGDHVDLLITIDLSRGLPGGNQQTQQTNGQQGQQQQQPIDQSLPASLQISQITMQNVEILSIGAPATDVVGDATNTGQNANQQNQASSHTLTFLLDPQDAVTLKYIKDSGGIIDLAVRSPNDITAFKTDAVGFDTIYQKFRFRFPQPIR